MGTRGTITIIFKNKKICLYNHWDSYPSGLGIKILRELLILLEKYSIEELIVLFDNIKIVNETIEPTEDDIKNLEDYTNLEVSTQSTKDWYCLLHRCQGSIISVLAAGYALDNDNDSTWIEYNYNIDLNECNFSCDEIGKNTKLDKNDITNLIKEFRSHNI